MTQVLDPLEQGRRFTLDKPQIEVAAAELRYLAVAPSVSEASALAVRAALREAGFDFAGMSPLLQQEVTVSLDEQGGQSVTGVANQGWLLVDEQTDIRLNLSPSMLVAQTGRYERWSVTFKPVLAAVLPVLVAELGVELQSRVGLRYVNRFVDRSVEQAAGWNGRIAPALLAAVVDTPFGGRLLEAHQQLAVANDDGTRTLLRHGAFPDPAERGAYSYVFDIDVFAERTEPLAPEAVLGTFEQMNRTAAKAFLAGLVPDYAASLGLTYQPEPTTETT